MLRAAGLAAALALAGCISQPEIAPGVVAVAADQPAEPGTVRFGITGLSEDKWTASIRQGAPDGSVRYGFTCKVLSCPDPTAVVLTTRRSRVERPDPKELRKIAKDVIPKLTQAENLQLQVRSDNRAKSEMLSSTVTTFQNYPAIFAETRLTVADRQRFTAVAMVFAGKVLVNIRAEAGDRAMAKSAIDDFVKAFRVEEGPPLQ